MGLARDEIIALDRKHVWHPYTSVDAWEKADPIVVASAQGSWLTDVDGSRYLDGNAQWWVNVLGHGHPRILAKLREQAEVLAHCSLAGIAHEPASALARDLVEIAPPGLTRVFYTDNGSSSVDLAVKIALQTWRQRGAEKKTRFIALDGAFHGDTIGASSLGGVEVFRRPYAGALFECVRAPFPEEDGYQRAFDVIRDVVEREGDTIAAVVVEPVVQGASGMRVYDPAFLTALSELSKRRDVLFVVDEVFTGYGRTGTMWAVEHAGVTPDIMCIGKAFAAILPMGATMVTEDVLSAFRGGAGKTLFHGHTFCGNPLGAALAREVLAIYRDEKILDEVARKAWRITAAFDRIRALPGVERIRSQGMIGAADLASTQDRAGDGTGYLGDAGWRVFTEARRRGAYLRPLGDTVYVCPPLTMPDHELDALLEILSESIVAAQASAATSRVTRPPR